MRTFFQTNKWSKWAGIIILLAVCINIFEKKEWEDSQAVIQSDIKGYYGFLPALFIHNDLSFQNTEDYNIHGDYKVWFQETPKGKRYIKFPTGMAMLYSPFFFIAHTTAESSGYPANGYSLPYRFALKMGTLVYLLLGLFFFTKLLRLHFDDRVTAITMVVLYLGTNLFYYTAYDGVYTHGHTFALFSAFLYGCIQWIKYQRWKHAILLGVTGGLMIAVRQVDLIFLPFILLYGVHQLSGFKDRFILLWSQKWQFAVGLSLILLMLVPQFLYNWYVSGSIFHYSYDEEGFFFGAPRLFESLLSYRNGWLVYSPIMIFGVLGLVFLKKRAPELFAASLFSLPIYYYALASWWCWWFVGFGNRAYINMYPLLAFSLAAFIAFLFEKHRAIRYTFNFLVLGALVLNLFQSWQFREGMIHWDSETKEHYWHIFGRSNRSETQDLFLETPDMESAKRGINRVKKQQFRTLSTFKENFEGDYRVEPYNFSHLSPRHAHSGQSGLFVPVNQEFSGQVRIVAPKGTTHIYATVWVKGPDKYVFGLETSDPDKYVHTSDDVLEEKNGWQKIQLLAALDRNIDEQIVLLYVWNEKMKPLAIDDINIVCMQADWHYKTY